jgi:hypothetical protein
MTRRSRSFAIAESSRGDPIFTICRRMKDHFTVNLSPTRSSLSTHTPLFPSFAMHSSGGDGHCTGSPYSGEDGCGWGSSPPSSGRVSSVPFSPGHSWHSRSGSAAVESTMHSPSRVVDGCSCYTGRGAGWGGAVPFSPGRLPYSPTFGSTSQCDGGWSSPGAGHGGLSRSVSRRAGSGSPALSRRALKETLRREVRAKATAGGVFPFCSREELGLGPLQTSIILKTS